jgi:homoserine acetyltransferase
MVQELAQLFMTNLLEIYLKRTILDATKYFIILTDDIGHGKSSKPSDGFKNEVS